MKNLLYILLLIPFLSSASDDIKTLIQKADNAYNTNIDSVEVYLSKALAIAESNKSEASQIEVLIEFIKLSKYKDDFNTGLVFFDKAMVKNVKLNNTLLEAKTYLAFAPLYEKIGAYDNAIEMYIKSVTLLPKLKVSKEKFTAFAKLAKIFLLKENYDKSLEYSKLSLSVAKQLNNSILIADANFTFGNIYLEIGELDNSINSYTKALDYFNEINNKNRLAQTYNNLGLVYKNAGEYKKAEENFFLGLTLAKEIKYLVLEVYIESALSGLYCSMKKYEQAEKYLNIALSKEKEAKYFTLTKNIYNHGYELYKVMGNHSKSLEFFEKYQALVDSSNREENNQTILELETKFRSSEKQKEIELLNTKTELQETQIKKRNIISMSFLVVIIFITGLTVVIYNSRKKQLTTNKILGEKNTEIELQQKEIIDSINYAKRIQDASLGSVDRVKTIYANASLLFQPKDILSGDFYWTTKKGNEFMFSVADCTGHGIPGAMMSMIGNNGLNDAVKEKNLTKPSDILNHLTSYVHSNFTNTSSDIKDGMDIAFCSLNTETNVLQYSGALNSLYVCKSNGEFIEIKGDKSYIGQIDSIYTDKTIKLDVGDSIYIMSDGYCDQFGGEKDKKFKLSSFKTMVGSINHMSADEQMVYLKSEINAWKGKSEQTDDICVLVVKI